MCGLQSLLEFKFRRRQNMKKLITLLLISSMLFLYTACTPEAGGTPADTGPHVDTTTLDGIYVCTVMLGGKPFNKAVYVINGDYLVEFYMSLSNIYSEESFEDNHYYQYSPQAIQREGLQCTYGSSVYEMVTDADGTWLVNAQGTKLFQKVLLGETGTPSGNYYFFFGNVNKSILIMGNDNIGRFNSPTVSFSIGTVEQNGTDFNMSTLAQGIIPALYSATASLTFENDAYTFSISGDNNFGQKSEVEGVYTPYVRETDWPSVDFDAINWPE